MMVSAHIKMALASLRSSRWRSALTMLGIIIGVVSVVTTVSIGEGVKRQVIGQINHMGKDVISVQPGEKPHESPFGGVSLWGGVGSGSFTEQDEQVVAKVPHMAQVVPIGISQGIGQVDNRTMNGNVIFGTNQNFPDVLQDKVEFGIFFTEGEMSRHVAVIGKRVAEQLLQENAPVGQSITIRGEDFIVRGVFEELDASNPLIPGVDLNRAIFIPYPMAKKISGGNAPIIRIIGKTDSANNVPTAVSGVKNALKQAHAGQEDFTILQQSENLATTNKVLNLLTQMITGIAAISLLVGGIGIMNILLVSVTERTREIGIRKAVGATNRQILGQFLIEAAVLSFVGGLIGVLIAILVNFGLRIFTNLHPIVTLPIILTAAGVSWLVGIVFGVTPAVKAARKDPIEALRYE